MKYIILDEVLAIHDDMIDWYGGNHEIRDLGLLQSALARPQTSFGGIDYLPIVITNLNSCLVSYEFSLHRSYMPSQSFSTFFF